jgi:hypothetical protein
LQAQACDLQEDGNSSRFTGAFHTSIAKRSLAWSDCNGNPKQTMPAKPNCGSEYLIGATVSATSLLAATLTA